MIMIIQNSQILFLWPMDPKLGVHGYTNRGRFGYWNPSDWLYQSEKIWILEPQ